MRYRIEYSPHALRQLRALPRQVQQRVSPHIDALSNDPRPHGVVRTSGKDDFYRMRVGSYRVIYTIEEDVLVVLVVSVGHRREIYRDL